MEKGFLEMKTKVIATIIVVLVLGFAGISDADIVELDLFSIGCPTEFDWDSSYWQEDFDLGVEFVDIDSVYIDWSGEITAGLAVLDDNPDEPFPLDVAISAYLDIPIDAGTSVWGGGGTYPEPEPFDCQSDFELFGLGTWSGLLDGQATIWLYYEGLIIIGGRYIESGSIVLDRATLRVEGVIVPEPATMWFLVIGGIWMTRKLQRNKLN